MAVQPHSVQKNGNSFRIPEMDEQEWYNQVYHSIPTLCMVMNPEGLIIDCNLALAKALGYAVKGEVQGRSIIECAEESSRKTLQQSFEIWKKTGKIHNYEFKMKRADGSTFPALFNATSIHDEMGRIIAGNVVILNITELANARTKVELTLNDLLTKERELHEINEELKRVERAKEEFVSMVSHELKNPLTPIIAFTDLIKMQIAAGKTPTQRQLDSIITVNQNAKEMRRLIDDILSVYKLDMRLNFNFTDSNVKHLIEQVLGELSSILAEKGIQLDLKVLLRDEEKDAIVRCDALRIKQVLSNLIRNSVDFVPNSEAKITVTLENAEISQMQTGSKSPALLVSLADNGPGIPEDKVAGLFKKFYQADINASRKHGGTGLGLTICKEIVEMHGGKIWYDSVNGSGACFKFLLPRLPPT